MRKGIVTGLLLLSLCALVGCSKEIKSRKMETAVVTKTSSSAISQNEEDLSPEEVAAKEGNHAEQVVVQVTDEGYVTSHGDHYHFYNGKVGFEALISQDLVLTDASYVLEPSHMVSDVADGHIIKVGESYYLYLTTEEPKYLR